MHCTARRDALRFVVVVVVSIKSRLTVNINKAHSERASSIYSFSLSFSFYHFVCLLLLLFHGERRASIKACESNCTCLDYVNENTERKLVKEEEEEGRRSAHASQHLVACVRIRPTDNDGDDDDVAPLLAICERAIVVLLSTSWCCFLSLKLFRIIYLKATQQVDKQTHTHTNTSSFALTFHVCRYRYSFVLTLLLLN